MAIVEDQADRVSCSQCGVWSYPHSICKCSRCGRRHSHHAFCEAADIRTVCGQCGVHAPHHSICLCRRCGQRHSHDAECVFEECPQCGVATAPHRMCLCRHCGASHTKMRGCGAMSTRVLQRMAPEEQQRRFRSRVDCDQCGVLDYPHAHCRCQRCHRVHLKTAGCRAPPAPNYVAAARSP